MPDFYSLWRAAHPNANYAAYLQWLGFEWTSYMAQVGAQSGLAGRLSADNDPDAHQKFYDWLVS